MARWVDWSIPLLLVGPLLLVVRPSIARRTAGPPAAALAARPCSRLWGPPPLPRRPPWPCACGRAWRARRRGGARARRCRGRRCPRGRGRGRARATGRRPPAAPARPPPPASMHKAQKPRTRVSRVTHATPSPNQAQARPKTKATHLLDGPLRLRKGRGRHAERRQVPGPQVGQHLQQHLARQPQQARPRPRSAARRRSVQTSDGWFYISCSIIGSTF